MDDANRANDKVFHALRWLAHAPRSPQRAGQAVSADATKMMPGLGPPVNSSKARALLPFEWENHRPNAASSTGTERTCATCPSGRFSGEANASRCEPWKDCASGTFVSRVGTDVFDCGCAPCAEGTESTSPNQAACTPKGTCKAGTVLRPGGGPSDCEPCEPGDYGPGAGFRAGASKISVKSIA